MKGLLLKDLYSLKKYLWLFAVSIAFFIASAIISNSTLCPIMPYFGYTFSTFIMFIPTKIILDIYNDDMSEKWLNFSSNLAVSRKAYINSKYILLTAMNIIYILIWAVIVYSFLPDDFNSYAALYISWAVLVAFLPSAISMIVYSGLGEVGHAFVFAVTSNLKIYVIMLIFAFPVILAISVNPISTGKTIKNFADINLSIAVNIFIYMLSWLLSVYLYGKRDL